MIYLNSLLLEQLQILFRLRGENRYFVKEGIRQMRVIKTTWQSRRSQESLGTEQANLQKSQSDL